jgi:regulator of protease activity HflC (stomatin/prohibitin superfamily)
MLSPERLTRAVLKFVLLVGLPLLFIAAAAAVVQILQPDFAFDLWPFLGNTLLLMLPGSVAMAGIFLAASWYLNALYGLGKVGEAISYLTLGMFGQISARPWMVVKAGQRAGNRGSTFDRIGGPGLLVIYNDSAVVTEQSGRLKRVLEPGYHRLEQFESIWEIIDLRPQHWVYPVSALTRDGIPITCDADVTFKIDDREYGVPLQPTDDMPHPFTKEAVLKAATATWIREEKREDQVMKWTGRVVISNTEGALRGILAQYRLDQLITPDEPSGDNTIRKEIRNQLEEALMGSAPKVGARMLNVDIGKIDIKVDLPEEGEEAAEELTDQVLRQWIETWQAELSRFDLVEQAGGEAELARLEAVSVQAQAEMVLTLTEAMQSLVQTEEASAYRWALRLIETLRWMSFDPSVRSFVPLETLRSLQKMKEVVEMDAPPTLPRGTQGHQPQRGSAPPSRKEGP